MKKEFPGRFTKTSPAAVELHVSVSGFRGAPTSITLAADKRTNGTFELSHIALAAAYFSLGPRIPRPRSMFSKYRPREDFSSFAAPRTSAPSLLRPATLHGRRLKKLQGKYLFTPADYTVMTLTYKFRIGNGKGTWSFVPAGRRNQKLYMYLHTNLGPQFTLSPTLEPVRFRWQVELSVQGMEILCRSAPLQRWEKRRLWKDWSLGQHSGRCCKAIHHACGSFRRQSQTCERSEQQHQRFSTCPISSVL